jgi:hypothetical protein
MLYNHETEITRGYGVFNRLMILAHVPDCEEVAGSGMRHIKECWRIVQSVQGVRHSQAFTTESQARDYLAQYTTPIEGI